ncbi:Mu transposase C-terminal domain-containing protein [Bacillus sp. ISL-39]|uniref:Mu transposase C-terminal domain-containing protein n=1 Tax=Bacillus sp. ISL-39 TaxID=2819124 RepID=UPI001BE7D1B4|nr:Mu transposase C-terminal domain-containing protein [Bacillus sp. ISL-39]MBT2639378.1 transposase [Bacillus sp. ISL-39]
MEIYSNEILVYVTDGKKYRVLWVDPNNQYTFLIDIEDNKALPLIRKVNDIVEDIIQETIIKERKSSLMIDSEDGIGKRALEIRDKAWDIIKDAVIQEPNIYIAEKRGKIIKTLLGKHVITKATLYKYLRKYWQRGKTPNALIADYNNSGGKGKPKVAKTKMGRPSKFPELESNVIVDEEIKRIFRVSLNKYYFNKDKNSLPFAYKMMVREFFTKDFYYENGKQNLVLKDSQDIPSIYQLRYFLKKEYTQKEKVISRVGKNHFEKNYRELLGNSTFESIGPGSRFQIDATIGDVYLISEYNPNWIIGRPVIYFVIDVFSRMIVGLYVGLEGPSWYGAMMAIANTVSDKEQFCERYDIKISKKHWPSEHLPDMLLADRGEFEGYNADRLINAFNLHVENAAPYRADWKGIVEKYFDIIQQRVKPFLPGYVEKDFKERGARDYRLDAKLTIKDLTKIIIAEVLHHNNYHYLSSYPRDEDMINDDVKPIPIELWNWGIKNRSGKLRYHSPDTVKLHLLPQENATVTEKGIRFRSKMHYSCETAIKESWFSTSRINGVWRVKIAYDPRDMSKIYLLKKNGMDFEVCHLLEHEERYKNKTIDDINYLLESEKLMAKSNEHKQLQSEINLINQLDDIVKSSIKKADEKLIHEVSKSKRVKSISDNRNFEKEKRREQEKFNLLQSAKNKEDNKVISEKNDSENEIVPRDYSRKSIKELMKHKINKK